MASTDLSLLSIEVLDAPVPVVRATGELDLNTAPQLCAEIQRAVTRASRRPRRVVIDLVGLAFCDSTGLRALIGAVREVEVLGGVAVVAVAPEGALDRLLELSGLREFLRVSSSAEEALRRLSPTRSAA
jgi:anti-sigma B factor antagonist